MRHRRASASSTDVILEFYYSQTFTIAPNITVSSGAVSQSFTVFWGDGTKNTYTTTGAKSHSYAAAGTYRVRISGAYSKLGNTGTMTGAAYLRKIISLGKLTQFDFTGCTNLTYITPYLPPTVTNLTYGFYQANLVNSAFANVVYWNTSNVPDMNF